MTRVSIIKVLTGGDEKGSGQEDLKIDYLPWSQNKVVDSGVWSSSKTKKKIRYKKIQDGKHVSIREDSERVILMDT